ncbi:hypothetical protein D3C84_1183300 [compost metagenome]
MRRRVKILSTNMLKVVSWAMLIPADCAVSAVKPSVQKMTPWIWPGFEMIISKTAPICQSQMY